MPSEEFYVKLFGLTGKEIAEYAEFVLDCPDCKAAPLKKCPEQQGRAVCKARFTAALKRLADVAEQAVRSDFQWMESWRQSEEVMPGDVIPVSSDMGCKVTSVDAQGHIHGTAVAIDDDPWTE